MSSSSGFGNATSHDPSREETAVVSAGPASVFPSVGVTSRHQPSDSFASCPRVQSARLDRRRVGIGRLSICGGGGRISAAPNAADPAAGDIRSDLGAEEIEFDSRSRPSSAETDDFTTQSFSKVWAGLGLAHGRWQSSTPSVATIRVYSGYCGPLHQPTASFRPVSPTTWTLQVRPYKFNSNSQFSTNWLYFSLRHRELQLDLGDGASTSRLSSVEWSIVRPGVNHASVGPVSNPVRMSTFRSDDEWAEQPDRLPSASLGAAAAAAAAAATGSPRSQRRSRSGRAADVRVFI